MNLLTFIEQKDAYNNKINEEIYTPGDSHQRLPVFHAGCGGWHARGRWRLGRHEETAQEDQASGSTFWSWQGQQSGLITCILFDVLIWMSVGNNEILRVVLLTLQQFIIKKGLGNMKKGLKGKFKRMF